VLFCGHGSGWQLPSLLVLYPLLQMHELMFKFGAPLFVWLLAGHFEHAVPVRFPSP
jgi:hypothetical protein